MQCKAKSKRSGLQCKCYTSIGKEVCRIHGGATPRGIKSKNFKHGRNSKYLPDLLASRFLDLEKNRNSGDLFTLKEQIELTELRLVLLIQNLNSGNSLESWKIVNRAFIALKGAIKDRNSEKIRQSLFDFEEAIEAGKEDFRSWSELFKAQRHYEKLITSERKRLVEGSYMISLDEVLILLSAINEAIKRTINDKDKLREISNELKKITDKIGFTS